MRSANKSALDLGSFTDPMRRDVMSLHRWQEKCAKIALKRANLNLWLRRARRWTRARATYQGDFMTLQALRWKAGIEHILCTSFLTRSGHVLCPDKKHPASAHALEARLPRSWLPWPRRSRPRSRSLPSDAAVWLSYAVSSGAVLSWWLYDQLLLVGTLVLWYVHHFPPLACNHMTIPGLYSAPPLNPSIRPYLSPTYEPLRPDLVAIWVAGDMAGSILYLIFELDTLNASVCGSADGQER